jgi:hypothetical protein
MYASGKHCLGVTLRINRKEVHLRLRAVPWTIWSVGMPRYEIGSIRDAVSLHEQKLKPGCKFLRCELHVFQKDPVPASFPSGRVHTLHARVSPIRLLKYSVLKIWAWAYLGLRRPSHRIHCMPNTLRYLHLRRVKLECIPANDATKEARRRMSSTNILEVADLEAMFLLGLKVHYHRWSFSTSRSEVERTELNIILADSKRRHDLGPWKSI